LAQRGDVTTQNRSTEFEDAIANIFLRCPDVKTAARVSFMAKDSRKIEYDLLAHWDGYLFIVECKFQRGVHSPADVWRAEKEIQRSFVQLTRQKRAAVEQWKTPRKNASLLNLPPEPLETDRISRVTATSIPHFTGQREKDLFVIDERCLGRFFEDHEIRGRK
jgi:hypothetical protein